MLARATTICRGDLHGWCREITAISVSKSSLMFDKVCKDCILSAFLYGTIVLTSRANWVGFKPTSHVIVDWMFQQHIPVGVPCVARRGHFKSWLQKLGRSNWHHGRCHIQIPPPTYNVIGVILTPNTLCCSFGFSLQCMWQHHGVNFNTQVIAVSIKSK